MRPRVRPASDWGFQVSSRWRSDGGVGRWGVRIRRAPAVLQMQQQHAPWGTAAPASGSNDSLRTTAILLHAIGKYGFEWGFSRG
jgi:hypothetical protein